MADQPYYEGNGVTLFLGDCLDVMPSMLTTVDAVIADLPYGTTRNHWDKPLPNKLLWSGYHGLCGPRTPIILFGTGSFTARLIVENLAEYRYSLVWSKIDPTTRAKSVTGFLNAKKQPLRQHEDLTVFYRKQPTYNPQMVYTGRKSHSRGTKRERTVHHYGQFENTPVVEQHGYQHPTSVLEFPRPSPPPGGHPNQKPLELMRWLVRAYSNPGDLILDNVAGSGTTLVAAVAEGRRAIGIELHEPYAEMIARRLESGSIDDRW